jgi:hypothetical protein
MFIYGKVNSFVHNGQRGSAHCVCDSTTILGSISFIHDSTLRQIYIMKDTNR